MDTLTLARSFTSLLLDTAAKGTALLLLACLAAWLCRRSSAALRHSIWCMTMGGLLVLPVASWALPAWQIPILPPEPLLAPVAEVVRLPSPVAEPVAQGATDEGFDSPVPRRSTAAPTVIGQSTVKDTGGPKRPPVAPNDPPVVEPMPTLAPTFVEPVAEPLTTIEWTSLLVSAGWLLGVSLFGVLLLVGLWRTVKLRRTSLTVADGEWPGMLVELRQRLGLSRSVELREHAESVVPLTWGIWRPVVLLPELARAWDEPMRRAVLLHELAHVQRGDVACQVLGRLTCVLYWFHPLAWFALRQLRQEREQACDDAVVGTGEKASDYAEQLLQVARLCCAPRGLSLGVAMAEGSSLERRVKSLFDSARSHGPLTRRVALALFAIGGVILAGLAPIEPTASHAERDAKTPSLVGLSALEQMELLKPKFGDAKRGIQLGVAFASPTATTYALGERIPMVLFFRNAGQKEVTFQVHVDFMAYPPSVVNEDGQKQSISSLLAFIDKPTRTITLKPDEVYSVETYGLGLGKKQGAPSFESPVDGKYTIEFSEGIFWNLNDPQEKWSEGLTSGTLEFEVTSGLLGQQAVLIPQAAFNLGAADTKAPFPTARQATVSIETEKPAPEVPGVSNPAAIIQGAGAGFIVNASGYIVTAKYVVDGARKIRVKLHDGTELPASVAGADPKTDLAVLLIHTAQPLTVMPEQHQVQAKVGDEVTAIGNAWGHTDTLRRGVVTGLNRDVELSETQKYTNLIQTDAANDPGYSGGPLLNAQGEAIGINIAFRAGAQKVAFAMPITEARKAYVMLMSRMISGTSAKEQMDLLKPVFGEAKRGIQLGLAVGSLERTFPQGGRIPLWLFYRNLGDKELTFHLSQDFMNHPPTVTDANGNRVQVSFVMHWMFIAPRKITLQPGEVWCIATTGLYLGDRMPSIKPVAGKYKLTYPQGIWDVNTTPQLRTDIPALPTTIPDTSLPNEITTKEKEPAPSVPAAQHVETPNWSESLTTGAIEFEIAPGKNGQLEARVLAAADGTADLPNPAIPPDIKASQVVTGVVVDARNQPVAGATVWCVVDQDKTTRQPITARVETNAQGEFRFTVPQSSLDYGQGHFQQAAWAWKQGHGIGVGQAVASTLLPQNPVIRLILSDISPIALQVVDEKGQPLAGADVAPERLRVSQVPNTPPDGPHPMLVQPPKELLLISTRKTDAAGRVVLDLVPRQQLDQIQIKTASDGDQCFSYFGEVIQLEPVTAVEGELSNHQAGVRLSVTTSRFRPAQPKGGRREHCSSHVEVTTDSQGRFSVPAMPIGPYTVASEELNGPQFLSHTTAKGELVAGPKNTLSLDVITGIPIKGRVVVKGENKGVANAALYVTTYKDQASEAVAQTLCQTNENGEYSSFALPGGFVSASLASVGNDFTLIHPHQSSSSLSFQQPVRIAADAKEATLPEIALDRGRVWKGTLVDEHNAPIDGVYVVPMKNGKRFTMPQPTIQGGKFGFLLLQGVTPEAWHLLVEPDEPRTQTVPAKVLKSDPLVLQIQRATVSMPDSEQPKLNGNPFSEYSASFSAEELEEAQVTPSELQTLLKKLGMTDAEHAQFQQVAADEMVGVVLDAATRQPVEGATIEFMCRSPKSNATTSRQGLFRVAGFTPQEPAFVIVRQSGYAPRIFQRQPGAKSWVILLDNRTYFAGTIADQAGQPVAGATIRATWETRLDENFADSGIPMETGTTSLADGTYRLHVPGLTLLESRESESPGFDIQVVAAGRGSVRSGGNFIESRTVAPLSLQLLAPTHFEAQVVDSVTGKPVPGYVLYTYEKPYRMGRSDANGRLAIHDMTPGIVMFFTGEGEGKEDPDCAGCEGSTRFEQIEYARWWSPDVRKDEDGPYFGQLVLPEGDEFQENFNLLHFDLQPGMAQAKVFVERSATISGRVTDPDGQPVEGATVVPARSGHSLTGDTRYSVRTDKDGRYVMHAPASKNSSYNLLAHDGDHSQWRSWANGVNAPFQTTPGQSVENVDLQLTRPGRVTGRVLRKGQPVANYLVRTVACDRREHSYYNPATKTQADGTFELTHVRPGKHFLQVGFYQYSSKGDQGQVIEVVAGETVADQILEAKEQRDPEEGIVKPPEPEPTPAVEGPAAPEKEPTPVGQNDKTPKVGDVTPVGKKFMLQEGNGNSITAITGDIEITLDLDKIVWWGEAVDGLEPGFWLTKSEDPRNLRIPMDSLVNYRVVVRNTTDKEIEFLVRVLPYDGMDVPYLIPSSELDAKGKIVAPQPAKEFQAQGAANVLNGVNAARIITLAAGESVLFPGEERLYVGKTDDIYVPRISDFAPGTHWIVQPLLVHPLSDKKRAELDRQLSEFQVTKIDRSGKTRQEPVVLVEAPDNSKGKFAYAKYHLEVGTLDASADRNAKAAIWGEVEQGMQCGIRILNPQPSYKIGDTLEAEVLWRNTSEAVISTTRPRQLDLYPIIEDAEGDSQLIDFGARYDLLPGGHDFQPGEVRSLGVARVTLVAQGTPGPKDNKEPGHIMLEPGKYKLSASGGVGNISPNSGRYEFTVAEPEAPQPPVVAPTKNEMTQFAPNIPQTRPNLLRAPTPAEPRPVVDMKRELLQRLVRGGKISSDSLNAMITLVSSEGAYDWEFISVILAKFDESCEPESKSSKRNLLAVLTKILEIHGSSRWQEPESGPASKPQAVIPDTESLSRLTSEILEHLIDQGVKADRSDIDAFVMALRQAHHADGKEFLRLVLQNPEMNAPSTQKPGLWADNMGGTWPEAKFHAAVALAELKDPDGVERLIEFARPNDFGLDESLFSLPHKRDASGSRRASSVYALIDLFGLKADADFAQIEAWWKANQKQFQPRRVALGRAAGIP